MVIAMCRLFSIFRTKPSRKFQPLSQSDEKISANFVQIQMMRLGRRTFGFPAQGAFFGGANGNSQRKGFHSGGRLRSGGRLPRPRESKIENGTPMCYTINASAAFMKQVQAAHHKIKQRS